MCDKYGILLILDEVMTGFGRTGKWFAAEHEGVVPDMMTFAKGVNSGYVPLGGVIVDEPIAKHFDANVLWAGLTYAGHPLACAAGVATIEAYREDGLIERGARSGEVLMRELRAVAERHPSVGDVRGKGLFIGIELVKDRKTKEMLERWNGPSAKLQTAIKNALMQRDVYILNRWNMLFVAPPLNVSEDEIAFGVKAIDEALDRRRSIRRDRGALASSGRRTQRVARCHVRAHRCVGGKPPGLRDAQRRWRGRSRRGCHSRRSGPGCRARAVRRSP